ncbi:DUF3040 domain-containing protein [Streptomyces sp. NPDC006482]|uniref:DUF3040 domain-containing protein n=1 Tax=unclassified Streptomyces TaxID=2593676 RepID=UPI00225ACA44|nr:DUF3040 domain-containing protein [Streptomyces sp. NBC_00094]MCX5394883.1 DUF3040 domain-containing protein [Streptomyces sp. NBC_00094]
MEEVRLSARERRALAEIEEQLDRDEPLAERLRTMRNGPGLSAPSLSGGRRRLPVLGVAVLGVMALALLVLAVATEVPALIWAFAAVWVLTLVGLLGLVVRWSRRRARNGPAREP